jgi:hypothetical protein
MTKVTFITKGIKVSKICKNEYYIEKFRQDMAAKYNVLFTTIPYMIKKEPLN